MNPCPCGYLGDTGGRCHCTEDQVHRYRQKISGPLLGRIDIHIEMAKVARTIADLATVESINSAHLSEAISYRRLDRK